MVAALTDLLPSAPRCRGTPRGPRQPRGETESARTSGERLDLQGSCARSRVAMSRRARRRQDRSARQAAAHEQRQQAKQAKASVVDVTRARSSLISPVVLLCAGLYAFHNSLNGPFIFD